MKQTHYLEQELAALDRSSAKPPLLDDALNDGVWFWDLTDPKQQWMSPSFWRALGYDAADMPHESSVWRDLVGAADRKRLLDRVRAHCNDAANRF
ncbi:MAG: PAS domain-containing protein, partial [Gammaproteobacteria bacterium]|nr:PAS domain-containing protein [Gammaproteobacteria bacterium]